MKRIILFLCAALLCGAAALAQNYQETVYLKNGSVIKGTVLEQEAGGNIKIMTSDGSIFVYKSDDVLKVTKEAVNGKPFPPFQRDLRLPSESRQKGKEPGALPPQGNRDRRWHRSLQNDVPQ